MVQFLFSKQSMTELKKRLIISSFLANKKKERKIKSRRVRRSKRNSKRKTTNRKKRKKRSQKLETTTDFYKTYLQLQIKYDVFLIIFRWVIIKPKSATNDELFPSPVQTLQFHLSAAPEKLSDCSINVVFQFNIQSH